MPAKLGGKRLTRPQLKGSEWVHIDTARRSNCQPYTGNTTSPSLSDAPSGRCRRQHDSPAYKHHAREHVILGVIVSVVRTRARLRH